MKEWNIYIFAVIWPEPYLTISHKNWTELLDNSNSKSKENLVKINEWKDAYINEIYYEWDYLISSYKNAYKDLSEEQKEAIKTKEIKIED